MFFPSLRLAGPPLWPQVGLKTLLEPCQRVQVGPGSALEDRHDRAVVDPRGFCGGTQASGTDRGAKVHGKLSRDLADRIGRRRIGPVLGEFSR